MTELKLGGKSYFYIPLLPVQNVWGGVGGRTVRSPTAFPFCVHWACGQTTVTLKSWTVRFCVTQHEDREQRGKGKKRFWKMKHKSWEERDRELKILSKHTAFLYIYKEKCTHFQTGRKAWNDTLSASENMDTIFATEMHCLLKEKPSVIFDKNIRKSTNTS